MSPSLIRLSNPVDIDPIMDVSNVEDANYNVICVQSSSNSEDIHVSGILNMKHIQSSC